ncbi:hypothetical protein [Parapedobacter tibetensis]|uniref:hypothetical protein n=1 Tax=Parapedobacter tibetensis TaxID=2972951 RepID=UPI00214D3390|nr:hypothetical protein [Parapedobacter tibetensis]
MLLIVAVFNSKRIATNDAYYFRVFLKKMRYMAKKQTLQMNDLQGLMFFVGLSSGGTRIRTIRLKPRWA